MRVYKPSYTKPLPEKARILSRKGKRFAKFKDAKGHTAEARLTKADDKILCETEHWHIEFEDNQQIRRHLKAFTNERASERLKKTIESLLACNGRPDNNLSKELEQIPHKIRDELVVFGVLDAERTAAGKPLKELIAEFEESLSAKERNAEYIRETVSSLKRIVDECKFKFWSDISATRTENYLKDLRDKGIGYRRSNGYLQAAKHFCNWMVESGYAGESPIRHLKPLNTELDRRHERRAATPDEIRRLLEITKAGPERYRMSGYERALIYRFAVETGFRAGEISTLTISCFDFDNLTVTVKAGYSKHRREDVQAIRPELAAMLKERCKGKLPTALVFGGKLDRTADMLKLDLKAAGIPYIKDDKYFDFHALRHTFVTSLRSVSSRTAQALARHQSSAMTDRYTHIQLHDERAALNELPDYGAPSSESQKATGTDDKILLDSCFQGAHKRTQTESSGKETTVTMQKTPLGVKNESAIQIYNPVVLTTATVCSKRSLFSENFLSL